MPPIDIASASAGLVAPDLAAERMVLFRVDEHFFALPIERVREIVSARPYTPLPGSDVAVRGLINLRGRMVTVLDLGTLTRSTPAAECPDHSIAILEHGARTIGLAVDDVAGIVTVDAAALNRAGDALRSLRIDRAYVRGVAEDAGRIFLAVDPDAILAPLLA